MEDGQEEKKSARASRKRQPSAATEPAEPKRKAQAPKAVAKKAAAKPRAKK